MGKATRQVKVTFSTQAWDRIAVEAVHRQTTMSEIIRGAVRRELYEQDLRVGAGQHSAELVRATRRAMQDAPIPGQTELLLDPITGLTRLDDSAADRRY